MISFNTVIENFNKVYEDRNSPEKHFFLNSSLQLIEDSSQKASFFDIIDALQSRKWEPTSETNTSEVSKKIKKLWLQTKFIYNDEPFSIRSNSKLIDLFDKSITEEIFLNPTKLEEYSQQIQSYCEILYLCQLIVHAEEKLANLSERIGLPSNLKTYYESLELKYGKVLTFQNTPEFYFLKNIQYTNPLLYLSVFIEGDEGQINKTHPELLEFFELAKRSLSHSKKKKSNKKKFTPEQIRHRLLKILENPSKEVRKENKSNNTQLLSYSYSFLKDDKLNLEEYQKFIKDAAKSNNDIIKLIEDTLQNLEESSEMLCQEDILKNQEIVTLATSNLKDIKNIFKKSYLPICVLLPLVRAQDCYIKAIRKFIETFRKTHTPLKDKDNVTISTAIINNKHYKLRCEKSKFFINKLKKCGRDCVKFIEIETQIFKEHFPTLFEQPDYRSNKEMTSQVKKEVEEVSTTYSILIKELSKIALANTSAQKKSREISAEYRQFLDIFISDSSSLPSVEEFISLNLKHPIDDFFLEKEVKALDQLITHFEDSRRSIFREKMTAYCEEYVRLKKSTPLKRPLMCCLEESFVSPPVQVEKEASCISKQIELKVPTPFSSEESFVTPTDSLNDQESTYVDYKENDTSCIVEQCDVNILESPLSSTASSSMGAIPKRTLSQKTSPSLDESESVGDNIRNLYSLRQLQSVQIKKKLPNFHYHSRIKRWTSDSAKALHDPAYKNLTKTKLNKKETVVFHSFPKIVDGLLGTNYCQEEKSINKNGDIIKNYSIPGMIIMQDIQYEGNFSYTVDETLQICFHRCFNPIRKSAFKKLDEDLNSTTQHFSHEELNIQCNPDIQTIRIDDPRREVEIYIIPLPRIN